MPELSENTEADLSNNNNNGKPSNALSNIINNNTLSNGKVVLGSSVSLPNGDVTTTTTTCRGDGDGDDSVSDTCSDSVGSMSEMQQQVYPSLPRSYLKKLGVHRSFSDPEGGGER